MTVIVMFKKDIHHVNLVKIKDMKYFLINEEVQKNDVKVGVGKIKTKT